jgi:hypothetical protein
LSAEKSTGEPSLKLSDPDPTGIESRPTNPTSDGELFLVGTFGVLFVSESWGKTLEIETKTASGTAPCGMRPVKVAAVIEVGWVRTKSSPVSVSGPAGCDVVAMRPSGLPVLKKNGEAPAG